MSTNLIDYGAIQEAAASYQAQAEAIQDIMATLSSVNSALSGGWQNQTSNAFINRYESDYVPALNNLVESLCNVSSYMNTYVANKQEQDAADAAAAGG